MNIQIWISYKSHHIHWITGYLFPVRNRWFEENSPVTFRFPLRHFGVCFGVCFAQVEPSITCQPLRQQKTNFIEDQSLLCFFLHSDFAIIYGPQALCDVGKLCKIESWNQRNKIIVFSTLKMARVLGVSHWCQAFLVSRMQHLVTPNSCDSLLHGNWI